MSKPTSAGAAKARAEAISSRLLLAFVLLPIVLPRAALADMSFHVVEVVAEEEIRPRQAHHTVRWEGDYYVSQTGVSVLGFGAKGGGQVIPYDQSKSRIGLAGTAYTSVFHRIPNGFEVEMEYGSFTLSRRVVQTGLQTCTDTISAVLKPGHDLFEVHRLSNHELMFETKRVYTFVRCDMPKLIS